MPERRGLRIRQEAGGKTQEDDSLSKEAASRHKRLEDGRQITLNRN
jgi:hypothetical protein